MVLAVLTFTNCSGSSSKDNGGDPCVSNPLGPSCPKPAPALVVSSPQNGATFRAGEIIPCSVRMNPHHVQGYAIVVLLNEEREARLACIVVEGDGVDHPVLAFLVADIPVFPAVGEHTLIFRLHRQDVTKADGLGEILREETRNITVVPAE